MSSIPAIVKRKPVGIANVGKVLVLITVCFAQPTLAQSDPSAAAEQTDSDDTELETIASRSTDQEDGNLVIDILDRAENRYGPPTPVEDCSVEQEAAIISGEIIVCRRKRDQRRFRTLDPESALARYADETAFRDDPRTPDFISDCHDQGWPAGCVRFGKVPEPALIIDVEALPQAPAGSDADRISRGLPPLGQDDSANGSIIPITSEADVVSPEAAEEPAGQL